MTNVYLESKATNITAARQSIKGKPTQRWIECSVHYQISVLLPELLSTRARSVSWGTVTGLAAMAVSR